MDMTIDKYARTGETVFAAAGLTALSDFLLFDGQFGLSLVLLGLAASLVALIINRGCGRERLIAGAAIYTLALLPILENISVLSVCVFLVLSAVGTLIISDALRASVFDSLWRLGRFFLMLPARSFIDIVRWRMVAKAVGAPVLRFAKFGVWIMPVVIGLVFLALFEDANPIIASFVAKIDLWYLLQFLNFNRLLFWALMFVLIWPFLKARLPERKARKITIEVKPESETVAVVGETLESILFGPAAILRSLLVFNFLFALQTLLDATYLIGGAALPDGMTYAAYAHRGAYPLIVTALLAALFVLVALRAGSAARQSRIIRSLVYVWVAQNVVLVLSSVFRLDLYVSTYGLTYWRIAAFIWMGLVALGLLSIIWRIWKNKDAELLVGFNLVLSATVLYVCCFVNFGAFIAHTNIELGRKDDWYVTSIGAPALSAIDRLIATGAKSELFYYWKSGESSAVTMSQWRFLTANQFLNDYKEWRSWTLRNWRLKRYLDQNPMVISKVSLPAPQARD